MNVFVGEAYSRKALWVLKVDTRECLITPTLPGGKSFNQILSRVITTKVKKSQLYVITTITSVQLSLFSLKKKNQELMHLNFSFSNYLKYFSSGSLSPTNI